MSAVSGIQCCSFFDFDVTSQGDEVELKVSAPVGAEPMLDALLDAFDGQGSAGAG